MNEIILLEDLGMLYTKNSKRTYRFGLYKCFCGKEFKAQSTSIKNKYTKSCGCTNGTHKLRGHRLYHIWNQMKQRCNNKNYTNYEYYGARGITICEEWLDINNFINDMYPSYKEGLSIDRIDNNKGYSKDNCRWSDKSTQVRNTRKIYSHNTSGYRGVHFNKKDKKWISQIVLNNKQIRLGNFNTAIEAAKAYDSYVINNKLEHTINFKKGN